MRYAILILLFLFSLSNLNAQYSEYEHFQFTIDDGLPSNECHEAVMDDMGYLWIATDRGLSRYDGYGFKNYGHDEGLSDISCLDLFKDHLGRIWISTFGKKVFIYMPKEDQIIEYKYNHVIAEANASNEFLRNIYIDSLSNLYLSLYGTGIFKIDSSGISTNMSQHITARYFVMHINDEPFMGYRDEYGGNNLIYLNEKTEVIFTREVDVKPSGTPTIMKIDNRYTYLGALGHNFLIDYDTIVKKHPGETFQDLVLIEDQRVITGQRFNRGLKTYENYEAIFTDKSEFVIPDISVSNILHYKDDLYVTTTDEGLYYLKKKSISTISHESISLKKISSLSTSNNGYIYAIVNNEKALKYNLSTQNIAIISIPTNELYSIHHFSNDDIIIGGNPQSFYINKNIIEPIKFYNVQQNRVDDILGKSIIPTDTSGSILIRTNGFGEYKSIFNLPIFDSSIQEFSYRSHTVLKVREGSYIIGSSDGLIYMDTLTTMNLNSIHPLFDNRINDIVEHKGMIYIGTQGSGVLVWDQKDSVRVINKANGLISNNIEKLHLKNENQLAVGTYAGLSIIEIGQSDEVNIENYTVHNGLPANDIYDFDTVGDTLLVATGKGIAMISSKEEANLHSAPLIEEILVNGSLVKDYQNSIDLDHTQNDVIISYKCLDLTMRGDILYQVKLNDNPWIETKSTSMNFSALQPGDYKFMARSANRDGLWGDTVFYSFTIAKPWWNTSWFYTLAGALSTLLLYSIYNRRIRSLEKEANFQNEMASLERSALQAQMNPHFIFNCLNSIQSFIMANEKHRAMEYLSKFAQLIRQNLEISTESKLFLSEEVDMLKNYIELEQVRFNNSFDYQISIGKDINQENVLIPPLLIQPYVENAILHGMKNKNGDGLIQITFERKEDVLKVGIKDNGAGMKKNNKANHKSMGMSITQKRLNFINAQQTGNYNIQKSSDDTGTEISIDITLS